ncbi:hypothetical protein XENTR_v10022487 [Xenopus tropicalis]|nr:circadian-associated transcriptional repressor isoform X2 [Xenopus tropicalis]XP_004918970.1 circadian-associated transcriptional repressor isoform X2 [Xenopus tropicalis]KAE8588371.1 hypothetical protein XENTR_v10022487 [Xenopus tropicalis]KAE8588372.1 hypothetical protein XENTR_v10022487 [Xenopus tropicalis]KAE8588373.1 hypothetical protein XENTR_v10022487 [Xenopus tropicalis]|eukprot:XP_002938993.2 PREDICTED: circadian-associated transcriptional repressor isoform X2 [Xenopus tropicalis]
MMNDTESSDLQSSYDSIVSAGSGSSSNREDPDYVDFDVFFSDDLEEARKDEEDYGKVTMIPNSRLSSADHPVLIRLENEYQARRSLWQQRLGQYPEEIVGRISCPSHNNLRHTPVGSASKLAQQKLFVCSEEANIEAPHGLKRQWKREAEMSSEWWQERQEKNVPMTEGDRIFAQKCRELQGFIKPLTNLLNGLKRGRYDKGLSSFQQSVAMDRIQRIVGVLQKPEMGERYLATLLQVEMMLKIWFPGVTSSSSSSSSSSDCDMEEPLYKMAKNPDASCGAANSCHSRLHPSPSNLYVAKPMGNPAASQLDSSWELPTMNLTWMHTAPICNTSLGQADLHHLNSALGQNVFGPNANNCGIILFLHSDLASSSPLPRSSSAVLEEKLAPVISQHLGGEETRVKRPLRCRSAPATAIDHSQSRPPLAICTERPAGENT